MSLLIVSNRLPLVLERTEGRLEAKPGSGGLISALDPVLRRMGGTWIGWTGAVEEDNLTVGPLLTEFSDSVGYDLQGVSLSARQRDLFYQGYSNEIIWPLFHDLQSQCNFVPEYWTAYQEVKHRFAERVIECARPEQLIWVQDYHLMGLARQLREAGLRNRLAFFLHIPFPPPDIFCKLPWRTDVLEGLLAYDLIGFQTPRDLDNFYDCVRKLIPSAIINGGGVERNGSYTQVDVFPIGIDYEAYAREAATDEVTQRVAGIRAQIPTPQILLGVDRLDYTKGIPYRLRAFELALKRYPELHRAVTLLQVVVPSRQGVPEYQELQSHIERMVTQINGAFTQTGWVPIHHVFRPIERKELLAYYRTADAALVTPLKDGMNLVAKEYCACQVEGDGVLILSEFAGAAYQLGAHALLVNPYDIEACADTFVRAARMPIEDRYPPMRALKENIATEDVYWWAERFLAAAGMDEGIGVAESPEPAPVGDIA